jgi:prepilin-type N-terminal cleavage/methylation domain-containing protein
MKRAQGFSLIELLIVVAIILIIAAIAIPNLLRARIAANESSAGASVRQMTTAEIAYNSAYPTVGYSTLATLGGAAPCAPSTLTGCFIDSLLTSGLKSGYQFAATGIGGAPNTSFVVGGTPQSFNLTGVRDFCASTDGVLRINPGVAGAVPPPDVATCSAYAVAP